jgi:hypothetical protein
VILSLKTLPKPIKKNYNQNNRLRKGAKMDDQHSQQLDDQVVSIDALSVDFDAYHALKKVSPLELWRLFIPNYNDKKAETILKTNLSEHALSGHVVKKCFLDRMFSAFNFVLESEHTELTIPFINELHWRATSKLITNTQYNPVVLVPEQGGKFRGREEELFKLTPENASREGIQAIGLKAKTKSLAKFDLKAQQVYADSPLQAKPAESVLQHSAAYVHTMVADKWKDFAVNFHSKIDPKKISTLMDSYINEYLATLKLLKTNREKLNCIVKFIQDCEQLHPYSDGNTRVFATLLLNHLLMQNHFPPAILDYPHHFKAHSLFELVAEVIRGIERTLVLMKHGDTSVFSGVDSHRVLVDANTKRVYLAMVNEKLKMLSQA